MRPWSDWHALSLLQLHYCGSIAQTVVAADYSDDWSMPRNSFVVVDSVVVADAAAAVVVAGVAVVVAGVAVVVAVAGVAVVVAVVVAASMA